MTPTVFNPLTGQIEDQNTTVEDLRGWEDQLSDQIGPLYRAREGIRRAIADRTDSPAYPKPRYRTDTQHRAALCPRCRRTYVVGEDEAA